jgi:Rrf2 family protein
LKISTKGRYGLEALVDLALHADEGHVNIKSVADRCGLPETYILQIFLKLRRAGIVESVRGAHGGYKLAKDAAEVTVGMVLATLEGPLAPVNCIVKGAEQPCDRYESCTTRELWEDIMETLNKIAVAVSVGDLVTCYRRLELKETAAAEDAQKVPFEYVEYYL